MTNRNTFPTSNTYIYSFKDIASLGGRCFTISESITFNSPVALNFSHNHQAIIDCCSTIPLCYVSTNCLQTAVQTSIPQTLLFFPAERMHDLEF